MEADIDEILTYELDETEVGEIKNCLYDKDYRNFRALGDRHVLFEGRNDKQWINVLRGRCSDLRYNDIFIMQKNLAGRVCDMDRFGVIDRADPTAIQRGVGGAGSCILGEFKPVTKMQVDETSGNRSPSALNPQLKGSANTSKSYVAR